jgi:hypothetical protein
MRRPSNRGLIFWLFLSAALLLGAPAFACSFAPSSQPFEFAEPGEEPPDEVAPPEAPSVGVLSIVRGKGASAFGASSSCDDLGSIWLEVYNHDAALGYRFEVLSGVLPDGLRIPDDVFAFFSPPSYRLGWIDGATNAQEAFAFDLAITAVDVWGRESEPFVLFIEDDGTWRGRSGCASAGGPATPSGDFLVIACMTALFAGRRRVFGPR